MEGSKIETTVPTPTPAQAPETSRAADTTQGSKVGGQTLPPGNSKLNKERREDFAQTIDLLAGELPEDGTPIDPSFLLDGPCGNADDILDSYRSQLQHILEYPTKDKEMENHKAKAYKALSYGVSRFKDLCIYEPVRDELLEWARSGFVGEAPSHYFDEHGRTRQKDEKTDATFKDRIRKNASGHDTGEDTEMRDADMADLFPSDMKPYQVQWEQATKLWREILDHPRIYVNKDSDCRARASKINYTIAERQLRDGKQRLDLKVPWEEMLVLLVYSVTHAVNPGDTSLPQDRESIRRGREALRERLARNRQPEEWAAMMDEAIEQKSTEWSKAREQHIPESKITERNTLWPGDFLKRLHDGGAYKEPSPESKEAASGGSADGGTNDGAANGSQSGRTGVNLEPTGDDMKPTPRKGVYRCELKPNYVTYEGKERKIGGLRDCGRTIRGVRVPMWQVLVQITDDDTEFCVWHIVASSKLGPRVAERYLEKGEKRVIGNMRGTAQDIEDISTFNWGGIAFIPHETDYRRPVTFIFGNFGEVNEFDKNATFWSRSLLGKHFNQAFVDERIDLLLGKTNAAPYPIPRKTRNQNRTRSAGRGISDAADSETETEEGSNFERTKHGKSKKDALHESSASEDDGDSTEAEYQEFLKFKARRRKASRR